MAAPAPHDRRRAQRYFCRSCLTRTDALSFPGDCLLNYGERISSVAQGQPGADSSLAVTTPLIQSAANLYGAAPVFWGRYFTSVDTTGSVEYRHAAENQPLNTAGIRLLPIARQTANVDGSLQDGIEDGAANAR